MDDTQPRIFLVVADGSPEMPVALRYAAWRARNANGRVALFHVIKPQQIQPFRGVDQIFTADAVAAGKAALRQHEEYVEQMTGEKPALYIRRGEPRAELMHLLEQQPGISVLVLAALTGPRGPGPLITYLTSPRGIRQLKVPLIIVPDAYKLEADNLLV